MGIGIEIFGGEHQLRKPSETALRLSFSPYEEDCGGDWDRTFCGGRC